MLPRQSPKQSTLNDGAKTQTSGVQLPCDDYEAVSDLLDKMQAILQLKTAQSVQSLIKDYRLKINGPGIMRLKNELQENMGISDMINGSDFPKNERRRERLASILEQICKYKPQPVDEILMKRVEQAFFDYRLSSILDRLPKVPDDDDSESFLRDKLAPLKDAGFDTLLGRSRCCVGTREAVLNDLQSWATDKSQHKVIWLRGPAGTGKTTTTQTVAERLFLDDSLGASFFCSYASQRRSNPKNIIPTIAYQLAISSSTDSPRLRQTLVQALKDNPDIMASSLWSQFQKLIVVPARELNKIRVVVLDGLDECGDKRDTSVILSLLSDPAALREISSLKFLVSTSLQHENLPTPRLSNSISPTVISRDCNLQASTLGSDVKLFLKSSMSVKAKQLQLLVDQVGESFIVASTAQRYITKSERQDEALQRILLTKHDVNSLSHLIILCGPGASLPESCRLPLGLLVVAREPISIATLADLLKKTQVQKASRDEYRTMLQPLQSILIIPDDDEHPITFHHKSFFDFLIGQLTHTNNAARSYVDRNYFHKLAAQHCLEYMDPILKKNIRGSVRYAPNPKSDSEISIADTLKYCCRHWSDHILCVSKSSSEGFPKVLNPLLLRFLSTHQLHWMEVLGLLHELPRGRDSLSNLKSWLSNMDASAYQESLDYVNEGHEFITDALDVANYSVLHIYHSVLPFSPKSVLLRSQSDAQGVSDKEAAVLVGRGTWKRQAAKSLETMDWIRNLAFSHNRTTQFLVASGDGFCTLFPEPCELPRGKYRELPAESRDYRIIRSAAISCDDKLFATADRSQILVRNLADENFEHRTPIHDWNTTDDAPIMDISFHPSDPQLLLIRFKYGSIALWCLDSADSLPRNIAQANEYKGVACWHNDLSSTQILIGDDGGQVTLWTVDTSSSTLVATKKKSYHVGAPSTLQPDKAEEPPSTSKLDKAKEAGLNLRITAVASSPDGSLIASGSCIGSIVVFCTKTGELILRTKPGKDTEAISALQFSPSSHDNLLAYASGNAVSLCYLDVVNRDDERLNGYLVPFPEHDDSVNTIAFSPDGGVLASGGDDCIINFWNISDHHHLPITCISISDDHRLVISGSEDRTVRVRDKRTGALKQVLSGARARIYGTIYVKSESYQYIVVICSNSDVNLWAAPVDEDPKSAFELVNENIEFTFKAAEWSYGFAYCSLSRYTHTFKLEDFTGFFCCLDDIWGSTTQIECWTICGRKLVLAAIGILITDNDEKVVEIGHLKTSSEGGSDSSDVTLVARCSSGSDVLFSCTWKNASVVPQKGKPAKLEFTKMTGNTGQSSQCIFQERGLSRSMKSGDQKWIEYGEENKRILWIPPAFKGSSFWDWGTRTLIQGSERGMLAIVDFTDVKIDHEDEVLKQTDEGAAKDSKGLSAKTEGSSNIEEKF